MDPLYDRILVRPATYDDAEAVRRIRNDAVENTTAIWTSVTQTSDEAAEWWADHVDRGAAYVAEELHDAGHEAAEREPVILGYACWAQWRAKEGYRFTVEDSVYVRPGEEGRGIGRRLLAALVDGAREAGMHVMLADIESGNTASIALHARLGFETVGTLREIGTKHDRWLDLTIMRLAL